jgi:hypothetical protein
MSVFGVGKSGVGAGQCECVIDLSTCQLDGTTPVNFVVAMPNIINLVLKIKTDEVSFEQDATSLYVKPTDKTSTKNIFKTALLGNKSDEEIEELTEFVTKTLDEEFKTSTVVDISKYGNAISTLASLTKTIDYNQQIMIEADKMKFADNLAILKINAQGIAAKDVFIHRDMTPLFKGLDNFKFSDDAKWVYFDIVKDGIKILFVPKTSKWQFPSEEDIEGVAPKEDEHIVLEINSGEFFNMLDQYEGIFDTGTWIYHQVKMCFNVGWENAKEVHTEFDNMASEVKYDMPIDSIVENTDGNSTNAFEFILPTIHIKQLKELFMAYPSFKMTLNSLSLNDEHGLVVYFNNADISLAVVKIDK